MAFTNEMLNRIYDKTDGRCHICGKKLAFTNYGSVGSRGAWEVEHSVPISRGGTDHPNNRFPACIACNRGKATRSSRTARKKHGRSRAPLSRAKKEEKRVGNAAAGAVAGGAIGSAFGPGGAVVGALTGGALGYAADPEE